MITPEGELTVDKIKYYMRFAKGVEASENPCYSRALGSVVVDPRNADLVSIGHNGPPDGVPLCDDEHYLGNVVWPQLTSEEKVVALGKVDGDDESLRARFLMKYAKCKTCPRKIIGAESGKRLELCSCSHSEHDACVKAHRDITGFWLLAYMGVPCIECCKTIVNSGIKTVVCIDTGKPDYSPHSSRWLLRKANVNLYQEKEEYFWE